MFLLLQYTLLALLAIARAQEPNTAPPAPTGPAGPSGPKSINDCDPAAPGVPLITIGGSRVQGVDGPTTKGGETVVAETDGGYIIGKQTLERGSQIVVSRTTYSLGRGGVNIVVDGTTTAITGGADKNPADYQTPYPNSCHVPRASSEDGEDTTTRAAKTSTASVATASKTSSASTRSDTSAASETSTAGTVGVAASSVGSSVSSASSSVSSTGTSDAAILG